LLRQSRAKVDAGIGGIGSLLQQLLIELDGLRRVSRIESLTCLVVEGLRRSFLTAEMDRAEECNRNCRHRDQRTTLLCGLHFESQL